MDIYVQSFLNSATKLSVTITNSTTVEQLATTINTIENVDTNIMQFYINTTTLTTGTLLISYGVSTGTIIGSSNIISSLPTKESRQIAKLNLAKLRRQADGNTSAPFYRSRNVYNIFDLPTRYVGNTVVDNPNPDGLVYGRIWISDPDVLVENLEMEDGGDLLLEDGGFILLESST